MTKGREAEQLAADAYQHVGYGTYVPPKAKYRQQDVFGLFDLLAFGHDRLEGVQVKASRDASGVNAWFKQTRPYEEHLRDFRCTFMHRKDDCWRVARRDGQTWKWIYDNRPGSDIDSPLFDEVLVR